MPAVATVGSTFQCPHQFPMHVAAARELFTVDGDAVVVESDVLQATFDCTASGPGIVACQAVVSVDSGLSTTLRLGGSPAVLATVTGTTTGSPATPFTIISVNQSTLEAS